MEPAGSTIAPPRQLHGFPAIPRSVISCFARPFLALAACAALLCLSACSFSPGADKSDNKETPAPAASSSSSSTNDTPESGPTTPTASASSNPNATADQPFGSRVFRGDMQLGHCYSDVRDDHTHKLHVSCDQPHDIEVFHISEFTDATRPTNEVMAATADEQCAAAFENYVGIPADQSTFSIGPLYPGEESWNKGYRSLLSFLYNEDGHKLTTSAKLSRM